MTTLKNLTLQKHREAESQSFIKSIFMGAVDINKYIDYLYQLKALYSRLERYGDDLGIFDDMPDLKRSKAISLDYAALTTKGIGLHNLKNSTKDYLGYLETIHSDKHRMMAHIYVRHTGDLFGGQALARLLPGPNNMFKFENAPSLISKIGLKTDASMADEANIAFDFNIKMIGDYNE